MEPGPFIQTVSGRRFNPLDPDPAEVDVGDIARALSNQCRFGGNCRVYYSVAQHSCLVADLVAERGADVETQLRALLHDASEAYLVDLPHPLKHRSELGRLYAAYEDRLQEMILEHFGLTGSPPPLLKEADRALLATERRAVATEAWHWPELDGAEPLELEIEAWLPERAHEEFLARYERLEAARFSAQRQRRSP
jgi:5'-deoxynucleotidase YfbR-like HD superfamily hydrolase